MSRLFIKQKVFSWRDRFTVKNELDVDCYTVEGEFSFGKKLHIYDITGDEVAFIQQKVMSWKPRFYVFVHGIQTAEIVKEFTLFHPRYTINGLDWECTGNVTGHDYEVVRAGEAIVRVHKVWLSWGDSYELEIFDNRNEALALAVVLAIDAVLDMQEAAAASSSSSSN